MDFSRRDALRAGAAGLGVGLTGCIGAPGTEALVDENFEKGMDRWETAASIGPEEPVSAFEWGIGRSKQQAAEGSWSLEIFTEGDHDDGTAWAVTEVDPPSNASRFEASCEAWSESESFNTLRHLVMYLGPKRPRAEEDFPDPGMSSSTVEAAPVGGLRQPLHLEQGWREYEFAWEPGEVPETLYFAVGVSVVWEADATHYVDEVEVNAD